MAIHEKNGCRDLLLEAFRILDKPMTSLRIIELGNQRIKTGPDQGMRRLQSSASIFRWMGAECESIDINGRDHAHAWDLGTDLTKRLRRADLVTNFGTSEHVKRGQMHVFENVHHWTKRGGLMLHAVPMSGTCCRHGYWKYRARWFKRLARACRYEVLKLETWDKSACWPERIQPGQQVYIFAIMRRTKGSCFRVARWRDPELER